MIKSLSVRLCVLVYVKGHALNVLCVYVGGGGKESFTIGWEQIFLFYFSGFTEGGKYARFAKLYPI